MRLYLTRLPQTTDMLETTVPLSPSPSRCDACDDADVTRPDPRRPLGGAHAPVRLTLLIALLTARCEGASRDSQRTGLRNGTPKRWSISDPNASLRPIWDSPPPGNPPSRMSDVQMRRRKQLISGDGTQAGSRAPASSHGTQDTSHATSSYRRLSDHMLLQDCHQYSQNRK